MKTLRKTDSDGKSITLADPTDYRNTARIVSTRTPKKIGNSNLLNVRNEIIANFMLPIPRPVGNLDPVMEERASVRVSFSCSTANKDAVLALLADVLGWVAPIQADLANGFVPDNPTLTITGA